MMSNLQDDTPLDEHPQSKTHASALQISPEANPVFDQGPPTNDSQLLSNLTHLSSLPQSQSWGPEPSNLRVRNTRKAISPFKVTPAILPSQQPHPSSIPRPSPSPVSTMPTSDQKDPVDPSLLALVPSNNLSRPPETGNDEQIDAEQRDVAAEKLTNIDSDHANLPDIGFKRVREHSESGNDLKDFPVKRRTRKHSNKPPQRLSAQAIDPADFAREVDQEFKAAKQELIQKHGPSGPGRQVGFRKNLHSRAAIAERLSQRDAASKSAYEAYIRIRDNPEAHVDPNRRKPGPKPLLDANGQRVHPPKPNWARNGNFSDIVKSSSGRSRKSGHQSTPQIGVRLAKEDEEDDVDVSSASDSDRSDSAFRKLSLKLNSEDHEESGDRKTEETFKKISSRGRDLVPSYRGTLVDKVRSDKAKAAWVKRRARAKGAKSKGIQAKIENADGLNVLSQAAEADALQIENNHLHNSDKANVPEGILGLGRGLPEIRRREDSGSRVLGLGGGLPQKRGLYGANAYPHSSFSAPNKIVHRHNLHVDERDMQNHCAIFNGVLYISGIRVQDASLQYAKTYESQLEMILTRQHERVNMNLQVLATMDKLLRQHGSSKNHLLTATILLQSPEVGLEAVNKAWKEWIPDPRCLPARSILGGQLISPDANNEVLVEINLIAAIT